MNNKKERLDASNSHRRPEVPKEKESYSTTKEFASVLHVEPQTIIRGLCLRGNYLGIKPIKLPNHRLLWPRAELEKLLK